MRRLMPSMLLLGVFALCLPASAQDFTIAAVPSVLSVGPGGSGQVVIAVNPTGGFSAAIEFSLSSVSPAGAPGGVTATFTDPPSPPGKIMTVLVALGTTAQDYVLTVQGVSGVLTRTTTLTLTVPPPSFSLQSVSPNPVLVARGSASDSTVTTLLLGGFDPAQITYDISSSVPALPADVTVTFAPSAIPPLPGQALTTMTVTAAASAVLGSYQVTVRGSGGGRTSTLIVPLDVVVPYFTVGFDPPTANLRALPGGSTEVDLTATWQVPGYDTPISFAGVALPDGVSLAFVTPTDVPVPPGSYVKDMTVTVGEAVLPGVYLCRVRATAVGADPVEVTFNLEVIAGTLTLSLSPVSAALIPGGTVVVDVNATITDGFTSHMNFTVSGLPANTTATFVQVSPQGNPALLFHMTITTTASTPTGSFPLVVQSTWASLTKTQPFLLIVANADFTISATPATVYTAPGTFGTTTVSTVDSGTLNASIALSVTGLPAGVSAAFVPAAIPAPGTGSAVLTLTAAAGASQGTYMAQVVGAAGGITRSTPISLVIEAPFSIVSVSPSTGPETGKTAVTISGFGFEHEATLTFGGLAATSVVVVDARTITAVTPAHAPGAVDVLVTNEGGSSAVRTGGFTYTKVPGRGFYTIAPCRVIDTRTVSAPAMSARQRRDFLVVGGSCGIPASARAIALNVTVLNAVETGYLTLFDGDLGSVPSTSTINFPAARVRANNAVVSIGAGGMLGILNASAGTVDVIVDVVGYFE